MGIIDPENEIVNESSCEYWQNELVNKRIMLNELNKAILAVTISGIASYTLDTGQSSQTVRRQDLPNLFKAREDLEENIRKLEIFLVEGKTGVQQAVPGY